MYSGYGMDEQSLQVRKTRRGRRAELPMSVTKTLKSCSVVNCEDWRDMNTQATYHCFPTGDKNQERWEVWTHLLRKAREDDTWIPFRGSLVCSHHFRPEDFVNDPLSKRRKLIKNAIPSIFPSFTVDLSDPDYQIADDNDEAGYEELQQYENDDSTTDDLFVQEGAAYAYRDPLEDEEVYDDEVQVIAQTQNQIQPGILKSSSPFRKTMISSSPSSSSRSLISSSRNGPINGIVQVSNKNRLPALQPISRFLGGEGQQNRQQPGRSSQFIKLKQSNVSAYEASPAFNSLPVSLNPDLQIEVYDPEKDLDNCRQRIAELEEQNLSITTMYENSLKAMQEKYESQLAALRRKLQQQERLLSSGDWNNKRMRSS